MMSQNEKSTNKDIRQKIYINKEVEQIIINCFGPNGEKRLLAREIKKCVKKYIKEDDSNIQKKIERMAHNEYLKYIPLADGDYLYYINKEIDLILTRPFIEPQSDAREKITTSQMKHSSDLKEAIQTWINNFSEPSQDYPAKKIDRYPSVVSACESHSLFTDLANHLPALGSDICEKWDGYKKELAKLDELKERQFSFLRGSILKCFLGMKLSFIYDDEIQLQDYECNLNPISLYNLVKDLELGEEGYHDYCRFLSWLEFNAPIIEKGDRVFWGEAITYLVVPKKDRAQMEAGISKFRKFCEDIPSSTFPGIARDIRVKVDSLKLERTRIISELKRTLFYTNFPGKCEYDRN